MSVTALRRQGGFSLLELLVAFVIMAFSLGMLYQAAGGTVRSLGDTEQQLRASMLAQSVLNSRDSVPGNRLERIRAIGRARLAGQQQPLRDRASTAPALPRCNRCRL